MRADLKHCPLSALQEGEGGRGPRRRRGRVRWASASSLESPTAPQPSPPPGAEREDLRRSRYNQGGTGVTTYFCDGLKEVSVVNGVVRLEFHRLEAVQRGGNRELQPTAEFTIALPLQGFLQALGVLENVRGRFAEQGLIQSPGSPEGAPPPAKSPNFS